MQKWSEPFEAIQPDGIQYLCRANGRRIAESAVDLGNWLSARE